jgi:hypothetical protein
MCVLPPREGRRRLEDQVVADDLDRQWWRSADGVSICLPDLAVNNFRKSFGKLIEATIH